MPATDLIVIKLIKCVVFLSLVEVPWKLSSMRVLEIEAARSYTMGKNKKHKLRKSKENDLGGSESSEEGGGEGCIFTFWLVKKKKKLYCMK